ncbi:F420-dependent NADP oxidoreductase, partial [Rhizobiaceae sp. 2RAB30]
LEGHGVADSRARDYVTGLFKALAHAPETAPHASFMELAEEYATRGGINEQVLRELTARNLFDAFAESLDGVHRRILGK